MVKGLEKALRGVGVEQIRNEVRALPDAEHLGEHLYGVCRAPMALTYREPGYTGGLQTQLLYGEPLFLLDRADDFYLLHAGDGYWGWVPCAAVEPMTAEQFGAYMGQPRGIVSADIENERVRIPRSACVRVVQTKTDERVILLADGTTLSVPTAVVSMQDPDGREAADRVRAGLDLLYTPYVFGARSHVGLDCSGLAGSVQAPAGHRVARDAWQQAIAGQLVATRWNRANIRPGDQLFFINEHGKIYHTSIALDAEHVVHSAPPCVQINGFNPHDPLCDPRLERDFFLAKRP